MIFCEQCGTQLKDTAKFCNKCGTQVQAAVEQVSADIVCAKCGGRLEEGEAFCSQCGVKAEAGHNITQQQPVPLQPAQPTQAVPEQPAVAQIQQQVSDQVLKEGVFSVFIQVSPDPPEVICINGILRLYNNRIEIKNNINISRSLPIEQISSVDFGLFSSLNINLIDGNYWNISTEKKYYPNDKKAIKQDNESWASAINSLLE